MFTDAEFEQSQTQADYLSLAEIVYYMDVLSRAYQRMGKGTGDRTELEMALVKLCSPELDVTGEAFAARLTALERAVKKGISVQTTEELPVSEPKEEPPEEKTEKEEKPEPVEQKQEKPAEPEEKEEIPEPKNDEKPEPPAPQLAAPQPQQGKVDIVKLSREAQPFPQWVEVVDALKSTSRSIAAAFSGSTAFENGSYDNRQALQARTI